MNSPSDSHKLAGLGRRLVATLIDAILVPAVTVFAVMVLGLVEQAEDFVDRQWMLHVLLTAIGCYLLLNGMLLWRRGQTVGKWAMGIMIVSRAGTPAPLWKLVLLRAWFFPLMFLLIPALVIPWLAVLPLLDVLPVFLRPRRALHDLLCGTTVVIR